MKSALMICPYYVRTGGWIALAGTHFHFIREIPMFVQYEIRSQIVGWDRKWFYIVHRFVTHRKRDPRSSETKNEASSAKSASTNHTNGTPPDSESTAPIPAIHTPSTPLTNLTPSPSSANLQATLAGPKIIVTSAADPGASASAAAAAAASVAAAVQVTPEPDGATVHCVSVNVLVYKHGKITVPPALVLAGEGFGATPEQGTRARERALSLGLGGMRELYRGGWREGSDRWWDEAMKGIEERVDRRVLKVRGVREGLEGALEVKGL